MKANVGGIDRTARIILGFVIVAVGLYVRSWWGLIGIIPLATGAIGYCGLYTLLGMSTCNVSRTGDSEGSRE